MKITTTKIALACAVSVLLANCGNGEDSSDSEKQAEDRAKPAPPEVKTAVVHPLPGDPVAGKVVYLRICSACHQPDGSGMNGMLAADFVKDKTRLAKSNEELMTSIRDGITRDSKIMPPMKDLLSETEIKDAISYIRKTFGGSAS